MRIILLPLVMWEKTCGKILMMRVLFLMIKKQRFLDGIYAHDVYEENNEGEIMKSEKYCIRK